MNLAGEIDWEMTGPKSDLRGVQLFLCAVQSTPIAVPTTASASQGGERKVSGISMGKLNQGW